MQIFAIKPSVKSCLGGYPLPKLLYVDSCDGRWLMLTLAQDLAF